MARSPARGVHKLRTKQARKEAKSEDKSSVQDTGSEGSQDRNSLCKQTRTGEGKWRMESSTQGLRRDLGVQERCSGCTLPIKGQRGGAAAREGLELKKVRLHGTSG